MNDCMYMIPHELTGIGAVCGLFNSECNGYGKHCLGYVPHNAESRKALSNAIAEIKEKENDRRTKKENHRPMQGVTEEESKLHMGEERAEVP